MGYSLYIYDQETSIRETDYHEAIDNLSDFNKAGLMGQPVCDHSWSDKCISISGSFGVSGQYALGFTLNLIMNLLDLGYKPRLVSRDFGYGTEDDWKYINS